MSRIRINTVAIVASRQVCLLSIVVLLAAGFCFAQPAVTLSIKSGPPTGNLLVSGSGFTPYAEIDIYFDSHDEATATADGSGSFSNISLQVPRSALPGKHFVSAVQRTGQLVAQTPFLVNTNWGQYGFRSDGKRDNHYENVLTPSTVGSLNLLWSYTTGGAVQSSPSVADGVVYVNSTDNNLYALNASTGAKLWSYPTGGLVYDSPAVANGVVYDGLSDDNLYALNASTGAVLWSDSGYGYPFTSSPAVADGVVYFIGPEAVNASTGAVLWTYCICFQINASPTVANGVFYSGSLVNAVFYAIDANTGVPIWTFESGKTRDYAFSSSPSVSNGVVYASSDDGNLYALNASTGTLVWDYPSGGSTAVTDGVVYAPSLAGLNALNASTGALLWNSSLFGSPAVAGGVVYFGGSGDNNLYALNASTGASLWSYTTGGTVETRPAIANGVVYVGSDDGKVYAFGLTGAARTRVLAKQEAASHPPDLRTLRPDFNLKVSQPAAIGGDTD
jgi:outer membrane protein assembly factor BamB